MSSESTKGGGFDSRRNNGIAETTNNLLDRPAQMLAQSTSQSQSDNSNIVVQEAAVTRFLDSLRTEQLQLLLQFQEEVQLQLSDTEHTPRQEYLQQEEPHIPELILLLSVLIGFAQHVFNLTSNAEQYTATEGTRSSTEGTLNNTPRPAPFTFNNRQSSQRQEQHPDRENHSSSAAESVAPSTSTPPSISSAVPRRILRHEEGRHSEYSHESFPRKLYRIIKEAEEEGNDDIISFIPSGLAFRVHKPKKFQNQIIPRYFGHSRYSSFRRLLGIHCFRLLQSGPDAGCFCHEYFRRGSPDFCDRIVRREG